MKVSMQAEALRYALAGCRVFPVRGKVPLTGHGVHDATTDEKRIANWWATWPEANIGLCTEGLVVIDVDPRNGGDVANLPHELPPTCIAHTGGGGLHYVYRAATGSTYPGKLGEGIDIKSGPGAYVVVAPSLHASGKRYRWANRSEPWRRAPSPAPAWLQRVAIEADLSRRARERSNYPNHTIAEGGRNSALTSLAGRMRAASASSEEILSALRVSGDN